MAISFNRNHGVLICWYTAGSGAVGNRTEPNSNACQREPDRRGYLPARDLRFAGSGEEFSLLRSGSVIRTVDLVPVTEFHERGCDDGNNPREARRG